MSRLAYYAGIWVSLLITLAYGILYVQAGYLHSKFAADWLALIGLSFMSALTTPVAYRAFLNGIRSDRDRFIFSYWLIWTLIFWHRVWIIALALVKQHYPMSYDIWYFSPVSGFIAIGFAMAAGFGGVAPLSGDIPLPKREIIIFTVAAGFSGIIAGIAIGVFLVAGWTN